MVQVNAKVIMMKLNLLILSELIVSKKDNIVYDFKHVLNVCILT